ncbi:MarR family transcriptional regulator [Pandoraea pnomenusa]|uniref:Multiple antibiotic resistance protein marR n=2 Tax=Pandoraea pnomenusa TaxID=93220 RepID=A0A378YDB8_9BURK|nr:MarR family transcriptional regulator [Pandoraea pnomenusa]QDX21691.1 MarR family transcriptional regulator [Pandoraea pnomenusa]SUA74407.1 Multiple antibiotic resistance protein marR [Pandoraea pnomenusa]
MSRMARPACHDLMPKIDWSSRFGTLVHDVARVYSRLFDRRARGNFDLTRAQSRVLVMLHRYGVQTQAELAERMELTPMALVRLLDRLREKGLVRRERDPNDKRAHLLYLTEASEAKIDTIVAFANVTEREALADLTPDERAELARLLGKVLVNLTRAEAQCPTPVRRQEPGPE